MNSFKQLENDQVRLFAIEREERVFRNVESTLETMRFFGSLLEMYMPVMADTVVSLTGGEPLTNLEDETDKWLKETNEDTNDRKAPSGPEMPDDIDPIR